MEITKAWVAAALLLLLAWPLSAQDTPVIVGLTVKHNGKIVSPPGQVTLSFEGHSVQLPVKGGRFEVPTQVIHAEKVTFSFDMNGDRIRIADIEGWRFTSEDWTLLLADRRYDKDYQWFVPKGAELKSSCILDYESVKTDPGILMFDPHCRSKIPQGGSK
jgi:hypothetical protein